MLSASNYGTLIVTFCIPSQNLLFLSNVLSCALTQVVTSAMEGPSSITRQSIQDLWGTKQHLGFPLPNIIPTKPHSNLSQSLTYACMQQANPGSKSQLQSSVGSSLLTTFLAGFRMVNNDHYTTALSITMAVITLHIFSLPMQHNLLPNFICHIIRKIYFLKVLDGVRCISLHSNLVCRSERFYFMPGPAKISINYTTYNHSF